MAVAHLSIPSSRSDPHRDEHVGVVFLWPDYGAVVGRQAVFMVLLAVRLRGSLALHSPIFRAWVAARDSPHGFGRWSAYELIEDSCGLWLFSPRERPSEHKSA